MCWGWIAPPRGPHMGAWDGVACCWALWFCCLEPCWLDAFLEGSVHWLSKLLLRPAVLHPPAEEDVAGDEGVADDEVVAALSWACRVERKFTGAR